MAQSAVGTCTITRLRTGDSIYITFNVTGSTCIFYDDNGLVTKYSASNLVVTPNITSQKGLSVTINSVSWKINSDTTITAYGTSNANTGVLTISKDFASKDTPKSYVCTMTANITVNGYTQTVSKSFEITMAKVASNSYWGIAKTTRSQLDSTNSTATLTHELTLGGTAVTFGTGSGKYQVKWFKNGVEFKSGSNNVASLEITRGDVDGAAFFSCKFYVDGGSTEVEADGLTIIDLDDELKVICPDEVQVAYGGTASITPSLYNTTSKSSITSGVTWSALVKNNYTNATVSQSDYTFNTSSGLFSMQESKMYYTPVSGDANYNSAKPSATHEYSPIVIFTAEI